MLAWLLYLLNACISLFKYNIYIPFMYKAIQHLRVSLTIWIAKHCRLSVWELIPTVDLHSIRNYLSKTWCFHSTRETEHLYANIVLANVLIASRYVVADTTRRVASNRELLADRSQRLLLQRLWIKSPNTRDKIPPCSLGRSGIDC